MLAVQITLLQVLIVLVTKLISKLMIRAPFLRDTRKRNQKLQGMAALRKAEIRRMGDKVYLCELRTSLCEENVGGAGQGLLAIDCDATLTGIPPTLPH